MTKLTVVPPKKLSAYCIACGEQHSENWMRQYLDLVAPAASQTTRQRVQNKSGGILCAVCFERSMRETAVDDEVSPKIRAFAQRVVDVLDRERGKT